MIVPDVNLLVYAHDRSMPLHAPAKDWWESTLNDGTAVAIPWAVMLGFVRVTTNRRAFATPLTPADALARVRSWLDVPSVSVIDPGPRHFELIERLLLATGGTGNLVSDAHLAAMAIERQAELHSNDTDFGRFPGLRWKNPLAARDSPIR